MNGRRLALGLAAGLVLAGCATEPATSTTNRAATDPSIELVVSWGYMVTRGNAGTGRGSFEVLTAADKDHVLDELRSDVESFCPSVDACEVELSLAICAPELQTEPCSFDRIGEAAGWERLVELWSDAQRDQVAFLEGRNVNAHWVAGTLRWQREQQTRLLDNAAEVVAAVHQERDRVVDGTRTRLGEMGAAVRGEEVARLADTRWAIRDLERITARYQDALDRVRPLYTDVAKRFAMYREGESAAVTWLQDIATRASTADLAGLTPLKGELAAISGDENRVPQQLIMDAQRVRWELAHAQAEYDQAIAHHAAIIDERSWPRLDHTAAPRGGMDRIVGYASDRMRRVNDAVREVFDGVRRREHALVLVSADQQTRDQVRAAAAARTEAAFLDQVTARMTELWEAPPTVPGLNLPLLAGRVRVMRAFLQLEPLCAEAGGDWRKPGCLRVAGEVAKVQRYLSQTLPFTLRYGARKLRLAGAPEVDVAAIEAELTAGNLDAAVHRYDAALRAAGEG